MHTPNIHFNHLLKYNMSLTLKRTYITTASLARVQARTSSLRKESRLVKSNIKVHAPLPGPPEKDIMKAINNKLLERYDPEGSRQAMLTRKNGTLKPGMVVSVQSYNNYPATTATTFSGYLMGIKRAGIESSIRLRTSVMRVGTEMRFPVYSPTVKDITVIRATPPRKIRRAKLFYIRTDKHDRGSVDNIVKSVRNQAK